jgi:hypothetical protein
MLDQIIDAMMAPSLHDDAGHLIARLFTDTPTAYVLVAGDLGALRTQIPQVLSGRRISPAIHRG